MARNYRRNALGGGVYARMPGASDTISGNWQRSTARRRARPLATPGTIDGAVGTPMGGTSTTMRSYRTRGTPAPGPTYARSDDELDAAYDRGQAIDAEMSTDAMNDPRVTQQMGENFLKGRYGERYQVGRDQLEFELKAAQARAESLKKSIAKGTTTDLNGKEVPIATGALKGDLEQANVDIKRIEADLGAKGKPWTPEEQQRVMQSQAQRTMQGLYDQLSQTNDPLRKAALQRQIQEYSSTFNAQQRRSAYTRTQMAEVHKKEGLGLPLLRDETTGELRYVKNEGDYPFRSGAFSGDTVVPTEEYSVGMGGVNGRKGMPDTSSYGQYATMPDGYGDIQGQLNRLTGLMVKPAQFSTPVERAERRDLVREITSTLSDNVMNYPETLQREILTLNSAARKNYPPEALEKYIHSVAKRAMQYDAMTQEKMGAAQNIQNQKLQMEQQKEEYKIQMQQRKEELDLTKFIYTEARNRMEDARKRALEYDELEKLTESDRQQKDAAWAEAEAAKKEMENAANKIKSFTSGYEQEPQQPQSQPQTGTTKQPSPVNPNRTSAANMELVEEIIKRREKKEKTTKEIKKFKGKNDGYSRAMRRRNSMEMEH